MMLTIAILIVIKKEKTGREKETKPRRIQWCTVQLFTTRWLMPSPSPSSDRCLPTNSPRFIRWVGCSVICNIPLATLGQLSWPCCRSTSRALLTGRAWSTQKSLSKSNHCSATNSTSMFWQHYSHKSKTQHCTSC